MKKLSSFCLLLLLSISISVQAEPLTALIALLVADKLVNSDEHKTLVVAKKDWRHTLNLKEIAALQHIKQHPAIQACIKQANDNHPAAQYHLRKIAQFSIRIKTDVQAQGSMPDIQQYTFLHPGKGFNWCQKQAGMTVSSITATNIIKSAALQLARASLNEQSTIHVALLDN